MLESIPITPEAVSGSLKIIPTAEAYLFQAYQFGEPIKLKEVAKRWEGKIDTLKPNYLSIRLGPRSYVFLYNFGTAVFFHVEAAPQRAVLDQLLPLLTRTEIPPLSDEFCLEENPRGKNAVTFDKVVVDHLQPEKIELMALVLAQSSALDFFENKVEQILSQLGLVLEPLGEKRFRERNILRLIRQVMRTKQDLVATLCLLEKPDETWDDESLDNLYQEATLMFELKERFRTLDYKLKTIQENSEILANVVTNRQHLFLEATIVALIVVEVVLFCYDLFLK